MFIVKNIRLVATGFLYAVLVSINTYQVAHAKWIGVAIVSFLLAFVWTINVRSVTFSSVKHRMLYALGASIGTLIGLFICQMLYK